MEAIYYRTNKLEKACNSEKEARKQHGSRCAEILMVRMAELDAADSLQDIKDLSDVFSGNKDPRLHPLAGKKDGQYAIDLEHPKRLIIEPCGMSEGESEYENISHIMIMRIENYHK